MPPDRRMDVRQRLALKVRLPDGRVARVRDIGPHGMFLLLPLHAPISSFIAIEFDFPRMGLRARALGQVIRYERGETESGVALRLRRLRLHAIRESRHA